MFQPLSKFTGLPNTMRFARKVQPSYITNLKDNKTLRYGVRSGVVNADLEEVTTNTQSFIQDQGLYFGDFAYFNYLTIDKYTPVGTYIEFKISGFSTAVSLGSTFLGSQGGDPVHLRLEVISPLTVKITKLISDDSSILSDQVIKFYRPTTLILYTENVILGGLFYLQKLETNYRRR